MDKTFELQGIEFEWDEDKYAVNLWKHKVKFEEVAKFSLIPKINLARLLWRIWNIKYG